MLEAPPLVDRVRQIVAYQLGLEPHDVVPEANILDDLGADSLDVVELVMAIEQSFGFEVSDADVERMRTIGDVEKYVLDRLRS